MKIKNRLSLYFTAISAIVLLIVQVVICLTFQSLVKSNFYDNLMYRANVAAQLYLEADEISPGAAQANVGPDNLNDIGARPNFFNSAVSTRHRHSARTELRRSG